MKLAYYQSKYEKIVLKGYLDINKGSRIEIYSNDHRRQKPITEREEYKYVLFIKHGTHPLFLV